MESVLTIFIFLGVIAVTALVFGGWAIVMVLRMMFRLLGMAFAPPRQLPPMPARGRVCVNAYCRAVNPGTARFCRRCGRELPEAERVSVRRAAMW